MVPTGGSRQVKLFGAAGFSLSNNTPGIFTVVELPLPFSNVRHLFIVGLRDGTGQLVVKDGATVKARLDVDVKDKKSVKVTFNFVKDNAGHKTGRTHASVDALIRQANAILTPQANVEIIKHRVRDVTVNQNLRRVVRFSSHLAGVRARQHEWDDVIAHADATADLNIYFVWEYEQDRTPLVDDTNAGTLGSDILMDDDIEDHGVHHGDHVTMAHEVGHALGVDHTAARITKCLLSPGSVRTDVYIPKAHANTMNP